MKDVNVIFYIFIFNGVFLMKLGGRTIGIIFENHMDATYTNFEGWTKFTNLTKPHGPIL